MTDSWPNNTVAISSKAFVEVLNQTMIETKPQSVALAAAAMVILENDENSFYYLQLDAIISDLNMTDTQDLDRIFGAEERIKVAEVLEEALKRISNNPLSIYLTELCLRLKYGDASLCELYAQEKNRRSINDFISNSRVSVYEKDQ